MELTWRDFQKIGDLYYKEGNIKEANYYWKYAESLRDDVIGKQMDIMNVNQQIRNSLERNENG